MMRAATKRAYARVHLTRTGRQRLIRKLIRTQVLDLDVIEEASDEMFGEYPQPTGRVLHAVKQPKYLFVYVFRANGLYKIGQSVDPDWRATQLQTALAYPLEIVVTIRTLKRGLEKELHKRFHAFRQRGEWFALTDEDIEWIKTFGATVQA